MVPANERKIQTFVAVHDGAVAMILLVCI